MSTNLKDALTLIENTLANDQDIIAWCLEKFNKQPTVIIGIDPHDPPEFEPNCPMICVASGGRARESNQAIRMHMIHVGCAINCDITTKNGNVTRFKGIDLIDEFYDLVEQKITKAMNQNSFATTQEPTAEDETVYPYFKVTWSYAIRCPSRI